MAILNSAQLWNERNRLAEEQTKLVNDGRADDARIIEGQIKQLDLTIGHVIEEEDKLRNAPKPQRQAKSLAEMVLGARDEFHGLEIGYRQNSVVSVPAPTETDFTVPASSPALLNNFANTLQEVPATGSIQYMQRSKATGEPETWSGVTEGTSAKKAEVIYNWKNAVANPETIAGYVPVSKPSLQDYDELENVINNDLSIDLELKTNAKYLNGNNTTGIIGVCNTTGIQTFTTALAGKYFDAIRMMRTLVMKNARRIPTHVCISPDIKEAIDLYKTETGLYQALGDTNYWGMQVVEDVDCTGILVYDAFAAVRRSIRNISIEVGYANDQFVKNELSILAENTKALQVRYPDAFCLATKADIDKATA